MQNFCEKLNILEISPFLRIFLFQNASMNISDIDWQFFFKFEMYILGNFFRHVTILLLHAV